MTQQSNIDYATPAPAPRRGTLAAAMLLFGGLGLIVLGGCFMIGILMTIQHVGFGGGVQPQLPLTTAEMFFVAVLAVLGIACFGGAVVLLILGTRGLLAILRS